MTPWRDRALDEAALFNPAFIAAVLSASVRAYEKAAGSAMPLALSFLVVPIVLHKRTREALPQNTRTSLVSWINEHPEGVVGFAERTRALAPYVREAIAFAASTEALAVAPDLGLTMGTRSINDARLRQTGGDVKECATRAGLVGKWFAQAGDVATVFALWGVRP